MADLPSTDVWMLCALCGVASAAHAAAAPAAAGLAGAPSEETVVRLGAHAMGALQPQGDGSVLLGGLRLEPLIDRPLAFLSDAGDRLWRSFVVVGPAGAASEPFDIEAWPAGIEHFERLPQGGRTLGTTTPGMPNTETLLLPDDPMFVEQYGLIGVASGDPRAGYGAGVQQAWSIATGGGQDAAPVLVAVLDARFASDHPELEGVLRTGYNAVEGGDQTDVGSDFHGTHVSGIIAARTNNGTGIAGVSWGAQILPVRVVNDFGFGSVSAFADGLTWAVDNGADVVNISLGYPVGSSIMADAVEYAEDAGVLVVASAGNTPGAPVAYPAAYETVVAVGAIDQDGELWPNTSVGPELDLLAPGVDVLSLHVSPDGEPGYCEATGTSFAAPHVAGIAALMLAVAPELSPDELRDGLLSSTVPLPSEADPVLPGLAVPGFQVVEAVGAMGQALAMSDIGGCSADFNGDGRLDFFDITSFLTGLNNQDPAADIAAPFGVIDVFDVLVFLEVFQNGCE